MFHRGLSLKQRPIISFLGKFFTQHRHYNHSHPKGYKRIWPSAKLLMKKHNIQEHDLPKELKSVKKENIYEYLNTHKKHHNQEQTSQGGYNVILVDYSPSKKNLLPHGYYTDQAKVGKLMDYIDNLNKKHHKQISLPDFAAKALAGLIAKDVNLQMYFNENKISKYTSLDVNVYLKSFDTGDKEGEQIYINPHRSRLADIKESQVPYEDNKYVPLIRLFDYTKFEVRNASEIVVPPALLSLTICKPQKILEFDLLDKPKIELKMNYCLSSATTAFPEDVLAKFLNDFLKLVENPYSISL